MEICYQLHVILSGSRHGGKARRLQLAKMLHFVQHNEEGRCGERDSFYRACYIDIDSTLPLACADWKSC
jgi:hypothetical protein